MAKFIHNPHDHFFRHAMSNKRVAREFFIQHLPENILRQIDLDSLQFHKESFVDEELKSTSADVVYGVNFGSKRGFLYILVEHQSTVDHWICLRLVRYMINLMQFHHRQYPKAVLPVVYPLIFYNGSKKYNGTVDFFDLFGEHRELVQQIWQQPFRLIDTQKINDEELRQYQWAGVLEFVLKHRYARDFMIFAEQVMRWLHRLEFEDDSYDYIGSVLKYVFNGLEGQDIDALISVARQQPSSTLGERVMTFADQARQQGYEKGINEGRTFADQARQQGIQRGAQQAAQLIAKRMLEKGMSIEIICEVTGLDKIEFEKLQIK